MSRPSEALPASAAVAVIGAGAMGAGIAQLAAVAGHPVWLYDARAGLAEVSILSIRAQLAKRVEKNKLTPAHYDAAVAALKPALKLEDLREAKLVIEAIVEDLEAKRGLFATLEALLAPDAILASNTSSLSITAIAARLTRPERLVGMHFFNPAPLMPLVEVIAGVATDAALAATVFATAKAWGKTPVHARSTPGFIVNRVARPYYAEALRLLQEGVADVATLDAVMRDCGGFKMGPFELMDLIGHDVNYAVTRSVFDAYYGDPRFTPSLLQLELVQAGYLGRKSGRGFYDYRETATKLEPSTMAAQTGPATVELFTAQPLATALAKRLEAAGAAFTVTTNAADGRIASIDGAALFASDGRSATARAAASGLNEVIVIDLMLDAMTAKRAAIAAAAQSAPASLAAVAALLQTAGFAVSQLADSPGLAVLRTVAMLANEASDAVHQQVCSAEAVDIAMRGGVAYPIGPLEWAARIGLPQLLATLDHLTQHYGEPRYRASPRLRQQVLASGVTA